MTQTPPSTVFAGVSGASGVLALEHELAMPAPRRDAGTAAFLERAAVAAEVHAADDLAAQSFAQTLFPPWDGGRR
jgi:hypothetical protein